MKEVSLANVTQSSLKSLKRGLGSLGELLDEVAGRIPRSHRHLHQSLLHAESHAKVVEHVPVLRSPVESLREEFSTGVAEVRQAVGLTGGVACQSVWTSCTMGTNRRGRRELEV